MSEETSGGPSDMDRPPIWSLFDRVPEHGIVVRDEADGFHARVQPAPPIPWAQTAGLVAVWATVCGAIAWWAAPQAELRGLIWGGGMVFGALMFVFHMGRGYFPVEVAASRGVLYVDGQRRPLTQVGTVEYRGIDLKIHAADGVLLGEIHGVGPSVAGWLVDAIALMKEEEGS